MDFVKLTLQLSFGVLKVKLEGNLAGKFNMTLKFSVDQSRRRRYIQLSYSEKSEGQIPKKKKRSEGTVAHMVNGP